LGLDEERLKQERKTKWKVARFSAKIASVSDRPKTTRLGEVLPVEEETFFRGSETVLELFYLSTSADQKSGFSSSNLSEIKRVQKDKFCGPFL